MADANVQRGGMGTPDRLALRKARASCPTFPRADCGKAKVFNNPLVLMGDILSPEGHWRPLDLIEARALCRRPARVCGQSGGAESRPMVQIRLRFRFGFGGPNMRRWSSRGMGGLLLFAAGRGGGGSLIPV